MTDVLRGSARAARSGAANVATRTPVRPERPAVVSGVAAAVASAGVGLVVACGLSVIGWLVGDGGSFSGALVVGSSAWLVAHGSGIEIDGVSITLVPLGLVVLLGWLLYALTGRLATGTALARGKDVGVLAGGAGVAYGALSAFVAYAAGGPEVQVSPLRAGLAGLLVAGAASGVAAARASGRLAPACARLPARVRAVLAGAGCAAGGLVAVGLLLVVGGLVTDLGTTGHLWGVLDPGIVGGVALVLLCVGVLPNLALWAVAVLLGPGFSLGADTSVTLSGASLGQVPGLPVLAALPDPGPLPSAVLVLSAVPFVAGVVGGVVAARRIPRTTALRAVADGGAAGAVGGAVVGLLVAASGGAVGPGRMASAGPEVLLALLCAVGALAVGGAIGALAWHYRGARATDTSTPDETAGR